MNPIELEQQVAKVTMAMMTRNRLVAGDVISDLRTQMTPKEVAGIIIISLERLMWFDSNLLFWTIENLIPLDLRQEIKSIISISTFRHLIGKGLVPGKDFSIDANGKVLHNSRGTFTL
jgi:hypothetical protein